MNLFLVRHPRPDIETGICYGATDIGLPEGWQRETDDIKERLKRAGAVDVTNVYSSPLQRCALAAEYLFPKTSIVFDERLQEMDFGGWEMRPWSTIPRKQLDRWADDLSGFRPPGGETYRDLKARCSGFVEAHMLSTDADACIMTHGGVIRALLSLFGSGTQRGAECEQADLLKVMNTPVEYGAVFQLASATNAAGKRLFVERADRRN